MIITDSLATFGRYCSFMYKVFSIPDRWRIFLTRTVTEISKLGIDSIPLVLVISVFIGAVCTIQMQLNIITVNPFSGKDLFDVEFLEKQRAEYETDYLRLVRFESPITIGIDGKKGIGVVVKPLG